MQTNQTVVQDAGKSVTAYLASLTWDGHPRLDRWLIDCAGAEDTAYVHAVSRGMLLAAVRRARNPGCRFDQMPILEGPQGGGKSTALRILAGEKTWFTDDLPFYAFHEGTRVLRMAPEGKWIVEVPELESMSRGKISALKTCLSRGYDEIRMPYALESTRATRSFVIIGTINTSEYFQGETEKRRFWPVRVQYFNLEKLRERRDQLWAEAAAVDMRGESIDLAHHLRAAVDIQDGPVDLGAVETSRESRLVVTLAADCQSGDVEAVMQAVQLIRGVKAVVLQDSDLSDAPARDARLGASRKVRLPCPLTEAHLLLLKIRTACESLNLSWEDLENWTSTYFRAHPISIAPGTVHIRHKAESLLLQIRQARAVFALDSGGYVDAEEGMRVIERWIDSHFNQSNEPCGT